MEINNPAFVLFAAVSPLLIAFIKQAGFSRQINALIALACYIVIGAAGAVLSGEPLTIENAVPLIAVATVVGGAAYNLVWNNLLANDEGEGSLDARITLATSFVR
jgi:predicted exporter